MTGSPRYLVISLVTIGILSLGSGGVALAQSPSWAFPSHVLAEGELRNVYHYGGAKPHVGGCHGLNHPSWYRYTCNQTGQGLWLAAKNFTDPEGEEWTHKVAHIGYRNSGAGEFFPTDNQRIVSDKERPRVFVDELNSFDDPIAYDAIDPGLESAARVITETTAINGLTLERRIWAFSQDYHDDYHIIEYTLKNTGDVDGDGEAEVEQPLEDVYLYQNRNYEMNQMAADIAGNGGGWGRNVMHEVSYGKGLEDHNEDLRAQYAWLGYEPEFERWNSIGGPALDDNFSLIFEGDSLGRLTAAHMAGMVTLHADGEAHAPGETVDDDPDQPSLAGYISNGSALNANSHQNRDKMAREYQLLEEGEADIASRGSHADLIAGPPESEPEPKEEWRRRMANQTADPGVDIEGMINMTAYGPYDMEPGEEVRIVQAEGISGLSRDAAYEIGRKYKELWQEDRGDTGEIEYDADGDGTIDADERMTKNMWVMTARDSLFKMFRRAKANWESGFDYSKPPMPPREFSVVSGADVISISWSMYEGQNPPAGFELYRGSIRREGDPNQVDYELIAGPDELGPSTRSFEDTDVQRGIPYFYYIQAIGEETTTEGPAGTPAGVRLKSNRAYTQTYDPALLKRQPGDELADARVVPNPYTLTSDRDVRWPGNRDQIGFLDIPGNCTIRIYTESGQLVEEIIHDDGSGDEYWDLTTSSNQLIVSGIYGVSITDNETGAQRIIKFVVIR
jgi:hypothetical protein